MDDGTDEQGRLAWLAAKIVVGCFTVVLATVLLLAAIVAISLYGG